jgi:nucleoside-diphosphate-sugar epimerase
MTVAFVAGATGFTGRAIALQDATRHQVELRLQVRPGSSSRDKLGDDERIVDVGIDDHAKLVDSMRGSDAVMQLIGTVRAKFDEENSYETVDYGTTIQLLEAAKDAGVRHFILLSSVGAGLGIGSYLAWKKKTEEAVRAGGIPWTIVRPGYLAGDERLTDRMQMKAVGAFMRGLGDAPFFGWANDNRPINIQLLAQLLLLVAREQGPARKVLRGRDLWQMARDHELYDHVKGYAARG